MGFLTSSLTVTRFRLQEEAPKELWPQVPQKLKQYAFKDIDDVPVERAWGWVNFDDMLDAAWEESPPEKGEYLTFSLRLDTRRIPPAVLKKYYLLAMRDEKKARPDGRRFISRERRKELREQVKQRLMQRFLPVPAEFNVVWNTSRGIIFFSSTQEKVLHLFSEFFSLTFDLDLEPLTPFVLATSLLNEAQTAQLEQLEAARFV